MSKRLFKVKSNRAWKLECEHLRARVAELEWEVEAYRYWHKRAPITKIRLVEQQLAANQKRTAELEKELKLEEQCYRDVQSECDNWFVRHEEEQIKHDKTKEKLAAVTKERDDLDRRVTEYAALNDRQAKRLAAFEDEFQKQRETAAAIISHRDSVIAAIKARIAELESTRGTWDRVLQNKLAATNRAIVMEAAEIGKGMK